MTDNPGKTVKTDKIGFIGAGNMATAIIGAIIAADVSLAENIYVSDVDAEKTRKLADGYNVNPLPSNPAVAAASDIIFFSVKPQTVPAVLNDLAAADAFRPCKRKKQLISIAAGVTMAAYETVAYAGLSETEKHLLPIIRVMPNTPALVLSGTSAVCANTYASENDRAVVKEILSAMGRVFDCQESEMNAFTAVAGSGPAYGFYLIEAITQAGVELGIPRKDCLEMTLSTLKGALQLLETRQTEPEILRKNVTSPGGTTEAALHVLEQNQVKSIFIQAVLAAAQRAEELSG